MRENVLFDQHTIESISINLRRLRKARGWTLQDVEHLSHGRIRSVVMGSYERGTRSLSLARAIEIANLFSIPIADLLIGRSMHNPEGYSAGAERIDRNIFDQRRINELAATSREVRSSGLRNFIIAIAQRRSDWNGEIITLRRSDFDTLTLLLQMSADDLRDWLDREKIVMSRTR